MKRSTGPRRTPSSLSQSTHHQLNMYALAASAAGVSLLALVQPSAAEIVYTPAHRVLRNTGHYDLDLNHDGVTDFTIQVKQNISSGVASLSALPARGNGVEGKAVSCGFYVKGFCAYALNLGQVIGAKQPFSGVLMASCETTDGISSCNGFWTNVRNRYLGLKFHIKGKTHFGWARLSVVSSALSITATLTGYAYETIPNKAIVAGRTKGTDDDSVEESDTTAIVPTPEPANLGLLAIGWRGLAIWRRRESAEAMQ